VLPSVGAGNMAVPDVGAVRGDVPGVAVRFAASSVLLEAARGIIAADESPVAAAVPPPPLPRGSFCVKTRFRPQGQQSLVTDVLRVRCDPPSCLLLPQAVHTHVTSMACAGA
jgi:hypothetical protein